MIQSPSGRAAVRRSPAASATPDIVGLGPVGMSVTGLDSAWIASLAPALGPLRSTGAAPALSLLLEPWAGGAVGGRLIGTDLALAADGEEIVVHDEVAGVRARAVDDRGHLSSRSGRPAPAGRVLPFAIAPALLVAGAALVHAATVVGDDCALLVLGPSGNGKSTTAAAARLAGFDVAGDDLAVVWQDDGEPQAQGLARPVRMPADVAPDAPPVPADERRRRSPAGWASGSGARLTGVVLVGHGDRGTVSPADPVEVARTFAASCFATVRRRSVAPTLAFARGIAEVPAWDLRLAADRTIRLAEVGRALHHIVS